MDRYSILNEKALPLMSWNNLDNKKELFNGIRNTTQLDENICFSQLNAIYQGYVGMSKWLAFYT